VSRHGSGAVSVSGVFYGANTTSHHKKLCRSCAVAQLAVREEGGTVAVSLDFNSPTGRDVDAGEIRIGIRPCAARQAATPGFPFALHEAPGCVQLDIPRAQRMCRLLWQRDASGSPDCFCHPFRRCLCAAREDTRGCLQAFRKPPSPRGNDSAGCFASTGYAPGRGAGDRRRALGQLFPCKADRSGLSVLRPPRESQGGQKHCKKPEPQVVPPADGSWQRALGCPSTRHAHCQLFSPKCD
jgi:hypothetical protein